MSEGECVWIRYKVPLPFMVEHLANRVERSGDNHDVTLPALVHSASRGKQDAYTDWGTCGGLVEDIGRNML